jgi:CBS domain-containing protein
VDATVPDLSGVTVADVVVRLPKTLAPDASVADARAVLEDDHVHMLLLTVDGILVGTLVRDDLAGAEPDAPARTHAVLAGRTVAPDVPAEEAWRLLVGRRLRRLAVVDATGRLVGLLCLTRRLTGFCSDADVAARAADRPPR